MIRKSGVIVGGVITALVIVAVLAVGVFAFRWFSVETDRIVIENSRQYIIGQQRHLSGLAADCVAMDTKIAETTNQALVDTYHRQKDSIDRQIQIAIATLDSRNVPPEAQRGCK